MCMNDRSSVGWMYSDWNNIVEVRDQSTIKQIVFVDQYESREPGRAFTTKGLSSSYKYGGGTLYSDAASNYVVVSHQVGFTATETIQSKTKFEREALTNGVSVQSYHTDNGVFTSKEFMNIETGVSPVSVFTRTIQESATLQNLHTWGCPVYVLTPKLKDGKKIPNWEPRSRRGQYVGNSPMHASTVGLVRNLQTGTITPQFHLVFDNYYETVHSREDQEPARWGEMLQFNRFQAGYDEADYVPELSDEWLNQDELRVRVEQRQQERDEIVAGTQRETFQDEEPAQVRVPPPAPPTVAPPTVIQPAPAPAAITPPTVAPPPVLIANTRPTRVRTQPVRFGDQHAKYFTKAAAALCISAAQGLVSVSTLISSILLVTHYFTHLFIRGYRIFDRLALLRAYHTGLVVLEYPPYLSSFVIAIHLHSSPFLFL
jgi:hypothetical protein